MNSFPEVERIAVTLANFGEVAPELARALSTVPLIGLDIETEDSARHQGLNEYKKLVFDVNRTVVTGMSIYPDGWPKAWYFNLNHADVAGRIPWNALRPLLDLKPPTSKWVIHNAAFERTMLKKSLDWDITDYICTMVMAVSAYSPDEYDKGVFQDRDLGEIANLIPEIRRVCFMMQDGPEVQELLSKVIAKESDATHSYNGYVKAMTYGYGLKAATQAWFDYQMTTYEQVLGAHEHMGELTTEETAFYGCDDAIWCLRLYHRLLRFMLTTNPAVVSTFFEQELPMVEFYSESWWTGVRVNVEAIEAKQVEVRNNFADATRRLKVAIKKLLPFDAHPNEGLMEREEWYQKNHASYRLKIGVWAMGPDFDDPLLQATQLSGAIPNAWAEERKLALPKKGLNITHYMPMRVLMYDLFRREKPMLSQGKVQSDGWARGRLKEKLISEGNQDAADVLTIIGEMASMEQVGKLYLTPYRKLIDPETGRLYPVTSSMLATRRTSMSSPNGQQLAKRGESTYVRGFYQADGPFDAPSAFAKRSYVNV